MKDCEELKPKPKEELSFVDKRSEVEKSGARKRIGIDVCVAEEEANTSRCQAHGTGPKFFSISLGKCGRRLLGGHDLVRRMDRKGEVSIWCRKCSGYARQRMGPKLVNGC